MAQRALDRAEERWLSLAEEAETRTPWGWLQGNADVLLTMKAAWLMDTVGNKHARMEISAIKVAAPNVALKVVDRAIQVHGGGGVSDDFPLAWMYAHLRALRLGDGPDEVHKRTIAREELKRVAHKVAVPA